MEWQDHNDSCPTLDSISLFGLRTCPQYSIKSSDVLFSAPPE